MNSMGQKAAASLRKQVQERAQHATRWTDKMETDVQRTLELVEEACNAIKALLGDWVVMAETDDEAPAEVVAWLRAERNKFVARYKLEA